MKGTTINIFSASCSFLPPKYKMTLLEHGLTRYKRYTTTAKCNAGFSGLRKLDFYNIFSATLMGSCFFIRHCTKHQRYVSFACLRTIFN